MITYESLKKNEEIRTLIARADESLRVLGFTEHSFAHVCRVAETAGYILESLGYSEHEAELARIAAYLHDIGNLVNRVEHAQSGAVMAFVLLTKMGMDMEDVSIITTAIGNHHEGTGVPVNAIAAALILGDKADVRRSRVRIDEETAPDIHDRVNYSVTESTLTVSRDKGTVSLALKIDTTISSVADYFEIFMERMLLCRHAAKRLGLTFVMTINDHPVM